MNKSWLLSYLSVGLIALCASLTAGSYRAHWSNKLCCGTWGAHVEALYWQPTHCSIDWVSTEIDGNNDESIQFYYEADYGWGVRGGLDWEGCCWRAGVHYLWVRSSSDLFVNGFGDEFTIIGALLHNPDSRADRPRSLLCHAKMG